MDFATYQALAMRTSQWQPGDAEYRGECHRAYGAISLAGESGEVIDILKKHEFNGHAIDRAKLVEEAGDTMWSLACVAESHGFTLGTKPLLCTGLGLAFTALSLAALSGRVSIDIASRSRTSWTDTCSVVGALVACIEPHGITLDEALEHNVAKLRRRYPDGYSDAASIARADEGPITANHRAIATVEKRGVSVVPGPVEGE